MPTAEVSPSNYVSLEEAAEYLGVNPRTIRRRVADGVIPGFRIAGSRQIRVRRSDLDAALTPIPNGRVMADA